MKLAPLLVLLALLAASCSKEKMIPSADLHVKVERVAVSKVQAPTDIAPYDDALSWQEYKVISVLHGKLDAPVIRVAHWTVANGKAVPTSTQIGDKVTLSLNALDDSLGLDGVPKQDDLDILEDPPRFLAMLPPTNEVEPPTALRYDYHGHVSEQMKLYWKLRGQLRLVVMGNSHATKGLSPSTLLGQQNQVTPEALNLAPPGASNPMQCLMVEDYVLPLPKLEAVIWVISARNFNSNRAERRKYEEFLASPGYRHDVLEKAKLWPVPESKPVTTTELASLHLQEYDSWGWSARDNGNLPTMDDRQKMLAYIDQESDEEDFEWNEPAWKQFASTVAKLNARNVRVFVLTTPMHPSMTLVPPADIDGTSDAGFTTMVKKGAELDKDLHLTTFHDYNELGSHEFKPEQFYDLDHLNRSGAMQLTTRVRDWMTSTIRRDEGK